MSYKIPSFQESIKQILARDNINLNKNNKTVENLTNRASIVVVDQNGEQEETNTAEEDELQAMISSMNANNKSELSNHMQEGNDKKIKGMLSTSKIRVTDFLKKIEKMELSRPELN